MYAIVVAHLNIGIKMIVNVKSGRHVETGHCPVSTNHTTRQTPMFIKINETVVEIKPIEQILFDGFHF